MVIQNKIVNKIANEIYTSEMNSEEFLWACKSFIGNDKISDTDYCNNSKKMQCLIAFYEVTFGMPEGCNYLEYDSSKKEIVAYKIM